MATSVYRRDQNRLRSFADGSYKRLFFVPFAITLPTPGDDDAPGFGLSDFGLAAFGQ